MPATTPSTRSSLARSPLNPSPLARSFPTGSGVAARPPGGGSARARRRHRRSARLTAALGATLGATVCVLGVAVAPAQAVTVRVANAMPDSELREGVSRCVGALGLCATWAGTDDDHTARRPLDGFLVGSVPAGVGALVTDFAFEWEEVSHRSRVWESGPDADGGYQVDLTVDVMRGASLTSAQALRDYLTDYYERDPATWRLDPFKQHGLPGWHDDTIAFWLAAPGVGVAVKVDRERFGAGDLLRTAYGIRPASGR
ncbi:hypothetical protein ABZV93_26425 [Actinopolymorpha sp. NPDC004070]|uniref:hypothetical protein n=1 Tax=Actinopolymorpha sp. NPDC004070 TaxID=3154548 RepID=UPI0033AC2582